MRFVTGEHEMTAEAMIRFATDFDPQPFHLSPASAAESFFGELVASAWHTAAVTMKLLATGGPAIATGFIGASVEFTMPSPTVAGDVLHVELEVDEVVPSRRPNRGSVMVSYQTLNQSGAIRQDSRARLIAWRRHVTP
jgi:acyl dehydratase